MTPTDFRLVFDASPRPLLLIAADAPRYTMVAVNRAHAAAFGTTPQALEGHGVLEVFPADPTPDVAAFVEAIRSSLERVLTSRTLDQMPVRPYPVTLADGTSDERYWSAINAPVLAPDGRPTHIVSALQDVTGEVMERRSEQARSLLMREVDHRARNALAVVQSFVRLTTAPAWRNTAASSKAASTPWPAPRPRWRRAAGRADRCARSSRAELASLADTDKYCLTGPHVLLPPEHVQAMSMTIHELATNARKYGALSTGDGRLAITWSHPTEESLLLTWSEEGGPEVCEPTRKGFGSRLIAQLAQQLGGDVRRHWRPQGLRAELEISLAKEPSVLEAPTRRSAGIPGGRVTTDRRQAIQETLGWRFCSMAKLVFGMNQSLDGYVDHEKMQTGPALFRHWIERVRNVAASVYGRRMYEIMRYWDEDDPEWDAERRDFATAWRSQPKWVVSRSLKSVGPNATLVEGDLEAAVRG